MMADVEPGAIGGMTGRENRITRRKHAPVPECPLEIPYDVAGLEPGPLWWKTGD
jgi:hypothetical protein